MRRCRKLEQKTHEPFVAGGAPVVVHLRDVQGQAMVDQRVLHLGACAGNLVVGLCKFLQVMMAGDLRVHVTLICATPEHFQDDLRVLGIVLVPRVEHRFAIPRPVPRNGC